VTRTLNRLFTEDDPKFQAAVQEVLWGGQPSVHGIAAVFSSYPSPPDNDTQLRLEVTYPVPALSKTQVSVAEYTVSHYELRLEQSVDIALEVLKQLVGQVAPHLYEIDPRIGLTVSEHLVRYPLFDPPNMGELLYSARAIGQMLNINSSSLSPQQYLESGEAGTCCPFCEAAFLIEDKDSEIAWGGGNLGWVHRKCHPTLRLSAPRSHSGSRQIENGVVQGIRFKHPAQNSRFHIFEGLPSNPVHGEIHTDPKTGVRRVYTEDGWKRV